MKALILNNKVIDISEDEFEVASPLEWVDCDESVEVGFNYDGEFSEPEAPVKIEPSNSELRSAAFKNESDPLFFEYQRGEIEEQVWLDKVSEIRDRYPSE